MKKPSMLTYAPLRKLNPRRMGVKGKTRGLSNFLLMAGSVLLVVSLVLAALPGGGISQLGVAYAGGPKITSLTLEYDDRGCGSPVDVTLIKDQGKAHFSSGGDDFHGPISVADSDTFTVVIDSGASELGAETELEFSCGTKVTVHTSCSKPIGPGTVWPDGNAALIVDTLVTTEGADYCGGWEPPAAPSIDIEKSTNGEDADTPTGPSITVSGTVNWTYLVTNTGNVPLTNVTVTDNQGVTVNCPRIPWM